MRNCERGNRADAVCTPTAEGTPHGRRQRRTPNPRAKEPMRTSGRPKVIAVESAIAAAFVVTAAVAVTTSGWLLVVGLTGHGLKDAWQQHTQFVVDTRWWPPFCATVDWVAAFILLVAIVAGVQF